MFGEFEEIALAREMKERQIAKLTELADSWTLKASDARHAAYRREEYSSEADVYDKVAAQLRDLASKW